MNVENRLVLDQFKLRWYQEEIWHAVENLGYKKVLTIMPRRSGKDITVWNLAIRQALRKPCLVYYCLPTYSQARKCIWDAITSESIRFLDYIPKSLIQSINSQQMQIRFKNNSILQCIGADSYDTSLVGTNPYMIIFSEWSRCNQKAYEYARPILAANGGIAIFVTTPYGKNHCWHMLNVAKDLKDWYVIYKKTSEIRHIDDEVLFQEKQQMSPELYAQEYECSFQQGVDGAYYTKILDTLHSNGQVTLVPYEPGIPVVTAWDIGVRDSTTIIFAQVIGNGSLIRIIDCYSNRNVGLDVYAKYILDKPWVYQAHFAPHDIKVREWGGGAVTRLQMARELGINFTIVDHAGVHEGIESVRMMLPKCWIDKDRCASLINALENYYREWDEQKQVYKDKPVHNWASHYADAIRMLAVSLPKTQRGMTPEEFNRKKAEALYGNRPVTYDPRRNIF